MNTTEKGGACAALFALDAARGEALAKQFSPGMLGKGFREDAAWALAGHMVIFCLARSPVEPAGFDGKWLREAAGALRGRPVLLFPFSFAILFLVK